MDNLYKVTWEAKGLYMGFNSPQFLKADNEILGLEKFIGLVKNIKPNFPPNNIKIEEICKIKDII